LVGTTCMIKMLLLHCQVDVVVVALSLMSSCRCCRCIVADVEVSVLSSCCQVVEIINELLELCEALWMMI